MRLILIACLLFASRLEAATLYVNNSGSPACSDATVKASNTALAPWCTIGRAAWGSTNRAVPVALQAASAGDVVSITPGTYAIAFNGTNGLTDVYFTPANSGSSGSPIRFQSTTGARCSIVITNSGTGGAYLGSNNRDYIQFSDFSITESSAPVMLDSGMYVTYESDYGSIENSCLTGNPLRTDGNNYSAVRASNSTHSRVYNNTLANFGGQTSDENSAGVLTYTVTDIVVEHNVLTNNGTGFYQKGMDMGAIVRGCFTTRYNWFEDNVQAIRTLLVPATDACPNLVYQNVMLNQTGGSAVMWQNTAETGAIYEYAIYLNNTIVNGNAVSIVGLQLQGAPLENVGNTWWNNIVVDGRFALESNTTSLTPTFIDAEHNNYYSYSSQFIDLPSSPGDKTFAQWQADYSQDSASPAGITTDPIFANRASENFKLCTASGVPDASCSGASPALTLGRVTRSIGGTNGATIPAGAYITGSECIGLDTSCQTTSTGPIRLRRVGA